MATTVRQRNPRGEGERLREALVDAATELLAESPDVERLSVRAITSRAGVTPTALYLHFTGKEDLAREVKKRCFAELASALERGGEHAGDPPQQLRALTHAYLDYARENPGHYAMMFHTSKARDHRRRTPRQDIRAAGLEAFKLLVNAVSRCGYDPETAAERAATIWLALHGRAAIEQAMPWFPLPAEDHFTEVLLGAAAPPQ